MKVHEIFKVLSKKKILSVSIKDKSCYRPEENFMKKRPNTFSSAYSKIFRECFIYRTTLVAVFKVTFSIRKQYEKEDCLWFN